MMVIFLTGLVSMILMRTLRNDYAKYARQDDDLETLVIIHNLIFFLNHQTLELYTLSHLFSYLTWDGAITA